jgi:hypothetical protein
LSAVTSAECIDHEIITRLEMLTHSSCCSGRLQLKDTQHQLPIFKKHNGLLAKPGAGSSGHTARSSLLTAFHLVRLLLQGMPIDSSVAELITAQLFVLVQEAPEPIYFYINSTGIAVRQSSSNSRGACTPVM